MTNATEHWMPPVHTAVNDGDDHALSLVPVRRSGFRVLGMSRAASRPEFLSRAIDRGAAVGQIGLCAQAVINRLIQQQPDRLQFEHATHLRQRAQSRQVLFGHERHETI